VAELASMSRPGARPAESGPSADAEWITLDQEVQSGRALYALPEASASEDTSDESWPRGSEKLFVVAAPGVSKLPSSAAPQLSLTLILKRAPSLDDHSFDALVTGGVLAMGLTITPSAEELREAESATGACVAPLFVRTANWALCGGEDQEAFAEAQVTGNGGAVAFSQTINRKVALDVLAALRGGESDVEVRCDAEFRAVPDKRASQSVETAANGTTITFSTTHVGGVKRRQQLRCAFSDVVREAAEGFSLEALANAVCPAPDGTLQPIPWHLPRSRAPLPKTGFAAIGDTVAALPAVLKTSVSSRINAHVLAASGIAISPAGKLQRWQVADLVIHPPGTAEQNQNLPVIEAEAALWPDRVDQQRYWYAPEFAIVAPGPTMDATKSPFLFAFSVVGFGSAAKPVLEASVKFTLASRMSGASMAAWEALSKPRCEPVPTNGLSAVLIVPFVDPRGQPAETTITAAEVTQVEDGVEVRFALTDEFARLAYGALGTPGFQSSPARIEVAYCFPAYTPVESRSAPIFWGGKLAAVDRLSVRARPIAATAFVGHHVSAAHAAILAAQPSVVAAHPILTAPIMVLPPKTYGIRTQGRHIKLDAFVPCSTFGALYLQKGDPSKGEADTPIGCRDAWTLGQFQLRLYEPLEVDLGILGAPYDVYRSVQVPGRFLVVPKAYTITRYEPSDWRANRPALYLYSSVDAVHPERTTCILTGTLRPALTPADRSILMDALRSKVHAKPTLEWPTELPVEPELSWALPGGTTQITPSAARTPEGFQVSLGAGLEHILLLRSLVETSGITAGVTFRLADGTTIHSTLLINLAQIDGPWESGAVSAVVEGAVATLANHTERAADIKEVIALSAGAPIGTVAVERQLAPQETTSVSGLPAQADAALVNYQLSSRGGTLEEIRTFVEDLHTNVIFVSAFEMAAEQVHEITVEGRIDGAGDSKTASLKPDAISAEMPFVLPLTCFLSQPTLQYRVTFVGMDGNSRVGAWRDWRLDLQGNVIELKKDAVGG
jgi:hypothetical protein